MTLKWDPGKFKDALKADLLANADIVGKFVQTDAQRRLREYPDITKNFAPGDPRLEGSSFVSRYVGGASYRKYVANLMTFTVESDSQGVLIKVGVGVGRGGSHHGLYIELGSKTAPPRPFLRPAVFENAARIVTLLAGK